MGRLGLSDSEEDALALHADTDRRLHASLTCAMREFLRILLRSVRATKIEKTALGVE
jgi:hypothetical protein